MATYAIGDLQGCYDPFRKLLDQIDHLFPEAELLPVRLAPQDPEPGDETKMASLPVHLSVPEVAGGASAAAWHRVRPTLLTTWAAAAVVLIVAGWGLRNLVALTERRTQFAYTVTHELRTPLTTFRLYTDMLSAGLVPEKSKQEYLDTLNRESIRLSNLVEGGEFKKVIRDLLESVRAGKSLSGAMAEYPDVFPRLYVNMVLAGESGGVLESVLRQLNDFMERSLQFREELKTALTYPISLAVVAGLSLIVLFLYVIPKFSLIFEDVSGALPWITVLVIGLSSALSRYGWIVLIFLIVGSAGAMFYIRTPDGRFQWDSFQLRIWLVGDLLRKVEVARFTQTLAALLRGGVPLLDALGTVQGVIGNRVMQQALSRVQTRVKEGKGMIGPLTESGVFPPLALHMIAVGEETGKLEEMLANVADYYDVEVKRSTKRLTSMLEPALILGMGLIVGVVVISILMAIFSIHDLPF